MLAAGEGITSSEEDFRREQHEGPVYGDLCRYLRSKTTPDGRDQSRDVEKWRRMASLIKLQDDLLYYVRPSGDVQNDIQCQTLSL